MRTLISMLVAVLFLATAGCGRETSPMGPSVTGNTPVSAPSITGAAVSGIVVDAAGAANLTVSVIGTTVSGRVDGGGQFSLGGVPAGQPELRFSGGGADARVALGNVGDRDDIRITVRLNGGSAEIEERRRGTSDNRVEIEGRLAEVNPSSRTVRVAGTLVQIPLGATIRRGGALLDFSSLRVGDLVEINATLDGSAVTATEVQVKSENSGPGNPGNPQEGDVEVKGIVQNRSGGCPGISFTIGSTAIVTNASTVFDDNACARIANGSRLEVRGTRQSNGSVLARRIELEVDDNEDDDDDDDGDDDRNEVELKGSLSGRSGMCPSISFSVSGSSVVTNSSTEFKDGPCSGLANGNRVEVKGMRQSGGAVLAKRVEKKN